MDTEIVQNLVERYDRLPVLILQRSVERAVSEVELFDILDTVPSDYPLVWDNKCRRWMTGDLFGSPDLTTSRST